MINKLSNSLSHFLKSSKFLTRATPLSTSNSNPIMNSPRRFISDQYDEKVMNMVEKPKNVGQLNKKAQNVGTGVVGAPSCGDVLKLQIQVDDEGKIDKAVFKTFGCGSAIASSSYATELLQGRTLEEATEIKNTDISNHLKLPPVKLHCSVLAEEAIKAAITDYKSKQSSPKTLEQEREEIEERKKILDSAEEIKLE